MTGSHPIFNLYVPDPCFAHLVKFDHGVSASCGTINRKILEAPAHRCGVGDVRDYLRRVLRNIHRERGRKGDGVRGGVARGNFEAPAERTVGGAARERRWERSWGVDLSEGVNRR